MQADEFRCSRCFLVHHRSQLAAERNGEMICRECAWRRAAPPGADAPPAAKRRPALTCHPAPERRQARMRLTLFG